MKNVEKLEFEKKASSSNYLFCGLDFPAYFQITIAWENYLKI